MRKILDWIILFFKKNNVETKVEPIESKGDLKIALVRGHGGDDSGAIGSGTSEVEYNTWVMEYIRTHSAMNVEIFYGSSSIDATVKSKEFLPDITIQLHLNDADILTANGIEVLVIEGDLKSYPLAENFASAYANKFDRKIRREKGKKILNTKERGAASLSKSLGRKILVEPFFIKNQNDFVAKELYAQFFVDWLASLK